MARFDYYGLEKRIKDILDRDTSLDDEDGGRPEVLIEEEVSFMGGDIIIIELSNRDAPPEMQSLSAGTRTRFELEMSVWCYGHSFDRQTALQRRDDLLGKAELVLMGNRQFDSFAGVNSSWISGGTFENLKDDTETAFLSGAEIKLVADVTASN